MRVHLGKCLDKLFKGQIAFCLKTGEGVLVVPGECGAAQDGLCDSRVAVVYLYGSVFVYIFLQPVAGLLVHLAVVEYYKLAGGSIYVLHCVVLFTEIFGDQFEALRHGCWCKDDESVVAFGMWEAVGYEVIPDTHEPAANGGVGPGHAEHCGESDKQGCKARCKALERRSAAFFAGDKGKYPPHGVFVPFGEYMHRVGGAVEGSQGLAGAYGAEAYFVVEVGVHG